ncbi:conjugal transfer protein TraG N-terminal domain-containing protein [Vibrio sp. Makdt]|uniref:conjugal transfer protein TraG N-terminal domain-containing protein n=1 Tax=Vibrio sp. Makdt TaxID=2998828 RepID=UPI0022CD9978|nr:conjugal transfer protein TraG N-terminal domain-containing protein [Vibrio sp. Makdt]MDA0152481.1 conjugal transfer protein TraG N-terminal domain-containing protein [Vibrio sp. Makdt]
MADPLEIYTNGDMAFMEAILTGLGHVYNDGFLGPIFGMALLANCLMSLMRYIADSKNGFLTSFWQAIILYLIMFSSTTNIVLTKEGEGTRSIAGDFPIGVVAPAYFISMIGTKIAERFRQNIVVIDAGWGSTSNTAILDYGLSPLQILMKIRTQTVSGMFEKSDFLSDVGNPDGGGSGLGVAIGSYQSSCVEKAVKLAEMDPTGVPYIRDFLSAKVSTDYWKKMLVDEPWPVSLDLDGNLITTTCSDAHSRLQVIIDARAKEIQKAAIFGMSEDNATATAADQYQRMKDFYDAIDPIQGGEAMSKLSSNLYTAVMSEGACKESVLMGPEFVQACATQWDSIQGRRIGEASKADSFMEMLTPMVTFIEGFVFIISPFMILMVLFTGAGGLKMMGKYLTALLWVTLIPICQVAVDVYLNTYFNRFLFAMQQDGAGTSLASIYAQESVWTDLESFIAFAGTAQAMVPALAMFIIFAGVHTLQGMGAGMASGAAVDPSKLHANKAIGIKDGNFAYGQTNASEARNDYGSHIGGDLTIGHSSNLDSGASDFTMGVKQGESYAAKTSASRSHSTTLQSEAAKKSADAFNRDYTNTENYDINEGIKNNVSRDAAKTMSFADVLQKQYDFSQSGAEKIAATLQGSTAAAAQLKAGTPFESILGSNFQATWKSELGMSRQDQDAYTRMMTEKDTGTDTATMLQSASERVDDAYGASAGASDGVGYKEGYSEKEEAYFAASQKYATQVASTETLDNADTTSIDRSASAGQYVADTSVTQSGFISALNSAGIDQYRSDLLNNNVDGYSISDLRTMANHEPEKLNEIMNKGANHAEHGEQFRKSMENIGIRQTTDSDGKPGNWEVDTDRKFKAGMVNLSEDEYAARTEAGRTSDSPAQRQDMMRQFMTSIDDMRMNAHTSNEKEAMLAAGNAYERMASPGSGSIGGVDKNLVHGKMQAFAGQYKDAANDLIDVNTGYNKFLDDTGLKQVATVGEEKNALQQETGELNNLMSRIEATGNSLIESGASKIIGNYRDVKGEVNNSIMQSLDFGFDGNLKEMSASERMEALKQYVNQQHVEAEAKTSLVQEDKDRIVQGVDEGVDAAQKFTPLPNGDMKALSNSQQQERNVIEYSAEEASASNDLKTSVEQLQDSTKYFEQDSAKEAFHGMSDAEIAVFNDYISGGDTSKEMAVAAFEGQTISGDVNLGDRLDAVRTNYQNVKDVEQSVTDDLGEDKLNKIYVGAQLLDKSELQTEKPIYESANPYKLHGSAGDAESDAQKRDDVIAGVIDVSELSAYENVSIWAKKLFD